MGTIGGKGISEDGWKDVGAEARKEMLENITGAAKGRNVDSSILPT